MSSVGGIVMRPSRPMKTVKVNAILVKDCSFAYGETLTLLTVMSTWLWMWSEDIGLEATSSPKVLALRMIQHLKKPAFTIFIDELPLSGTNTTSDRSAFDCPLAAQTASTTSSHDIELVAASVSMIIYHFDSR